MKLAPPTAPSYNRRMTNCLHLSGKVTEVRDIDGCVQKCACGASRRTSLGALDTFSDWSYRPKGGPIDQRRPLTEEDRILAAQHLAAQQGGAPPGSTELEEGFNPRIQLIPHECLEPGDYVIITCPKDSPVRRHVLRWAEAYFKPSRVRVALIEPEMQIRLIRAPSPDALAEAIAIGDVAPTSTHDVRATPEPPPDASSELKCLRAKLATIGQKWYAMRHNWANEYGGKALCDLLDNILD